MSRTLTALALAACLVLLGACTQQDDAAIPAPFALTAEAMGRYCGMNVLEHGGPKGQIILAAGLEPIWFSSARDTVAFTLLPEEPKTIAAIYVSDMAAAPSWEQPGATNWIDARKAFYVVGSDRLGGMGVRETVPFSTREAALRFAAEHGGEVTSLSGIPADYVLGSAEPTSPEKPTQRDPHKGH